jgi:ankyrin repeat protein
MNRIGTLFALGLLVLPFCAQNAKPPSYPSFDYEIAHDHEIKPHRREIPLKGVEEGFNQLRLTLTVSTTGEVLNAEATGEANALKFWPNLEEEVRGWKFTPFEVNGQPVIASVEEYLDLVPPERLPKVHVQPPAIRLDSKVSIDLSRSGCFGTCPAYEVIVSDEGITFEGHGFVVAGGKHKAPVDPDEVRKLAARFVAADFYSMDPSYRASVTDCPTFTLAISIDGQRKEIEDYVGSWVGMPQVISQLENAVDEFAQAKRWIEGSEGLVDSLHSESYDFRTLKAQSVLKEAASRGQAATVRQLLDAGVPLNPLPVPKSKRTTEQLEREDVGWLTAASRDPETLRLLIEAEASKSDQNDKDIALLSAAESGRVDSVRALIAYGANPNADLSKLTIAESAGGMTLEAPGAGAVIIYAARSGNPEVVREILRYHPDLEARDREGQTAMFAAGDYRESDPDGARVECVRLLAEAGANLNAGDNRGNTPLHETILTDVKSELLKLGADVNARNKDGESPIFTTNDSDDYPLFIRYGADLSITNNAGETVIQVLEKTGPIRLAALRKAIEDSGQQ